MTPVTYVDSLQSASRPSDSRDIVVLSRGGSTTWFRTAVRLVRSWVMACGVVFVVPVAIIALPVALAARAVWRLRDGDPVEK
jgi:hypothetical protein